MGLMERGQEVLVRRKQQVDAPSGVITYRRYSAGALVTEVDLTGRVWLGRTAFRRTAMAQRAYMSALDGPAVVWGDRDYLIPAACFDSFAPAKPVRGDRITESIRGVDVVFEVMALPDEPEARPSNTGQTVWRVHVKKVG